MRPKWCPYHRFCSNGGQAENRSPVGMWQEGGVLRRLEPAPEAAARAEGPVEAQGAVEPWAKGSPPGEGLLPSHTDAGCQGGQTCPRELGGVSQLSCPAATSQILKEQNRGEGNWTNAPFPDDMGSAIHGAQGTLVRNKRPQQLCESS